MNKNKPVYCQAVMVTTGTISGSLVPGNNILLWSIPNKYTPIKNSPSKFIPEKYKSFKFDKT